MAVGGTHGIVVGASMAGLLAARAMAGVLDRVTVLDRDELPASGPRRGVPQGPHVHGLLPRGTQALEAMFPGLGAELEDAGAVYIRRWDRIRLVLGGHQFYGGPDVADPPLFSSFTRPYLESRVRARLAALPGVEIVPCAEATGLLGNPDRSRVTGVRLHRAGRDGRLDGDLVVDASGRGGRAPVWLRELGYGPVATISVPVDVKYASRFLAVPAGALGSVEAVVLGPTAGRPRICGLARVEDGRWLLSLGGYSPAHHPPADDAGFLSFAANMLPADVAEVISSAQPLGPVSSLRYPAATRRRYDRMPGFPAGLAVLGDALTSFNPIYGQGMTVAALQAEALRAALLGAPSAREVDTRRLQAAAARHAGTAWTLSTVADRTIPTVPNAGGVATRLADRVAAAAVDRLQAAAEDDRAVAAAFLRVAGLMDAPVRLCSPGMLGRVYGPSVPSRTTGVRRRKAGLPSTSTT